MTGYELSRAWFNFCFDNPEKVKPIHTAIFFFAMEHQNRLGGKEKFGFPSQMTMDAIGVKKYQTYGTALNEIAEWGFISFVERSKNQYSANIITINATPKKGKARGKALDKAIIKHRSKQGQSTGQGKDSINKPINQLTNKPTTDDDVDLVETTEKLKQINVIYDKFIEEVQKGYHMQWAEATYMRLKIKKGSLTALLKDFKNQLIIDSKTHANTKKLKDHLNNWLNKQDQIGKLEKYKTLSSKSLSI